MDTVLSITITLYRCLHVIIAHFTRHPTQIPEVGHLVVYADFLITPFLKPTSDLNNLGLDKFQALTC